MLHRCICEGSSFTLSQSFLHFLGLKKRLMMLFGHSLVIPTITGEVGAAHKHQRCSTNSSRWK